MKRVVLILIALHTVSISIGYCEVKNANQEYRKMLMDSDPCNEYYGISGVSEEDSDFSKLFALEGAALFSFDKGKYECTKLYAKKLITMSEQLREDMNCEDFIHEGNILLGRVALRQNDIESSKKNLLKAGHTSGSGKLATSGPNLILAKELIDKGENKVVIQYFELCKNFWKMSDGRLDRWIALMKDGGKPNFDANKLSDSPSVTQGPNKAGTLSHEEIIRKWDIGLKYMRDKLPQEQDGWIHTDAKREDRSIIFVYEASKSYDGSFDHESEKNSLIKRIQSDPEMLSSQFNFIIIHKFQNGTVDTIHITPEDYSSINE